MASGAGMERPAGCGSETDFLVADHIAFSCKDHGGDAGEVAPTLRAMPHDHSRPNGGGNIAVTCNHDDHLCVRRLTPRECERLQGFPDDHTLVPVRTNKKGEPVMAKDGPRYKSLGNSMAVPVMRWIGERIAIYEAIYGEYADEEVA